MRNKQSCSVKLFSGVGLALAAGLVVCGGMATGARAQAPTSSGGSAQPFSGSGGLDALGKAINDADPTTKADKKAAEEAREREKEEKAWNEAWEAWGVWERHAKPPVEPPEPPKPSKPSKAEENPDVVPIVGDSSGDPPPEGMNVGKKDRKGTVGASTGEQSATVHIKSSDRPKTGGVVAHEATAPRLQTKPASAKPPALAAAPKPPTLSSTTPAAGASVGVRH